MVARKGWQVQFMVPGEPVAKGRPRVGRNGAYTPSRTLVAEEHVGWCFRAARGQRAPQDSLIRVDVEFVVGTRRRVDIDNLAKTVLDALNGLAFGDDSQVVELHAVKRLAAPGEKPHTMIAVAVL